mmetsp:Transcript_7332/g.13703  ORF Transcript_7332/g.13703 Transcript_7332/m.13703 type:complete len:192 (-) Transcript_7332:186-761(-)
MIDKIRPLVSAMSIPVVHNGDAFNHQDFERIRSETGCASVMAARGALWNCSLFRKDGLLPVYDVCKDYLRIADRYRNPFNNTKYMILQMLQVQIPKSAGYRVALSAKETSGLFDALEACKSEPSIMDPKEYKIGVTFVDRKEDADNISKNRRKHIRSLEQGLQRLKEMTKKKKIKNRRNKICGSRKSSSQQ